MRTTVPSLTPKASPPTPAAWPSTTAGVAAVTATVGGGSQSVKTTFVVLIFTGVSVNSHTFGIAEGFPSPGFTGAKFALSISGMTSDYTWDNGGSSWVTVDDSGTVAFTAKGNSTPVTITATPKGGGTPLSYTFSVNSWFIYNGSTFMRWRDASNWCAAQGLNQPIRGDLAMGVNARGLGSMFSEWGRMGRGTGGFNSSAYWKTEQSSSDSHYTVDRYNGGYLSSYDTGYATCRQSL